MMAPHWAELMAPVPESVSQSSRTSSARSWNTLSFAASSMARRSRGVVMRMGSTTLIRKGSIRVGMGAPGRAPGYLGNAITRGLAAGATSGDPGRLGARMSLLLAVDVGNTNVVLGIFDLAKGPESPQVCSWRLATSRERTVDEYGLSVLALMRHQGIEAAQIKHVAISCVVPPLHPVLMSLAKSFFNVEAFYVEPGVKTGVKVLIDNPSELGADRLVNAAAGRQCCV